MSWDTYYILINTQDEPNVDSIIEDNIEGFERGDHYFDIIQFVRDDDTYYNTDEYGTPLPEFEDGEGMGEFTARRRCGVWRMVMRKALKKQLRELEWRMAPTDVFQHDSNDIEAIAQRLQGKISSMAFTSEDFKRTADACVMVASILEGRLFTDDYNVYSNNCMDMCDWDRNDEHPKSIVKIWMHS